MGNESVGIIVRLASRRKKGGAALALWQFAGHSSIMAGQKDNSLGFAEISSCLPLKKLEEQAGHGMLEWGAFVPGARE